MKVTAFVASALNSYTYNGAKLFLQKLQQNGDIECEIVKLSDYKISTCLGCKLCFEKGEKFCPLKDDRDVLLSKIRNSDGVIFATPNYAFHVSAILKIFLDRTAYLFHRPEFFGKTFTGLVAQGVYGGNKIVKYLNFIGKALGFNSINGICLTNLEPVNEKKVAENQQKIEALSQKFYKRLIKNQLPNPTLMDLFFFRMARTTIKIKLNENYEDFRYFSKKGWFRSDFYYPVKLSFFKKQMGRLFDAINEKIYNTNCNTENL